MRKEEFHKLLERQAVPSVDIHEMKSLLDRHPYSHVIRLAYLHSLILTEDDRIEQAVDEAAIHLPDRKRLHAFLQEPVQIPSRVDALASKPGSEGTPAEKNRKGSDILQRQYLTEAVQSSILLEVDEEEEVVAPEQKSQEPEIAEKAPENFLDFISGDSDSTTTSKDLSVNSPVIARFLTNEKREKNAFFDPERMAKKSLDDKGGLVSDTLARIYMNQGNLEKALEAYEQLILKYPEKSGYFAARIQKVKDLMSK